MTFAIAVLPGDGIGPEVIREAVRCLDAAVGTEGDVALSYSYAEAGADEFLRSGSPLPPATLEIARRADAVLLGAMGLPGVRWPDGTEMVPQVQLRIELDLYAGIRPVRWYAGVPAVLARKAPSDVDFVVVRESTEGMFASLGGGIVLRDDVAVDSQVITRSGTERVCHAAFQLARVRRASGAPGRVACVDKANIFRSSAFFRRVFHQVAAQYPEIVTECVYVDAAAMKMVLSPEVFDVIVTENLFGDILSDLGPALGGGLGMAPSADIGDRHAVFQPTHGTAPDLIGRGIANPLATILSAAMMLEWLAERHAVPAMARAAQRIRGAVAAGLARGELLTPDLGGGHATTEVGDGVVDLIEKGAGCAADRQPGEVQQNR